MKKVLQNEINTFRFVPTPIDISKNLSKELSIQLIIKRDDLFSQTGGGNKSRKLVYILQKAHEGGYDAIVTTGGIQSNHVRAAAIFAAKLGWSSVMVIHDKKPDSDFTGNLKIVKLTGSEIRFVDRKKVKDAMDQAVLDLKNKGYKPFYIWGGGHCVEGSFAYYSAVKELIGQTGELKPDFIVVANGTGTTQAGLEVGVRQFLPGCKVLGVSVSRNKKKGKEAILRSIAELNNYLERPTKNFTDIFFDDKMMGAGYEAIFPELLKTISWAAQKEGLILDPTYTGKAFNALREYVQQGTIPEGSIVVFWHTGGLLNLMASQDI